MRALLHELRRAPLRSATCVLAIALAIATMGVFAVPSVAGSNLRDLAARDHMAHLSVPVTELSGADVIEGLDRRDDVTAAEAQVAATVRTSGGDELRLVGADLGHQEVDVVTVTEGRLPTRPGEVVASPGVAHLGELVTLKGPGPADTTELTVVGVGGTVAWAEHPTLFAPTPTALAVTGAEGPNRVVARLADPTADALDTTLAGLRTELESNGAHVTGPPLLLPGGAHPIEDDIEEISVVIGALGIMAGIVGLVLLASTTNAIVAERTREAAVLRALGFSRRAVRRRLRRVALVIAGAGTVVGLPLGVLVSNVIARVVLERFAGVTPGVTVAPVVLAAGAAFGLLGGRLISGRAARRVTSVALADALRDHDGAPFGNRWTDRRLAGLRAGPVLGRLSLRNAARRRGRSLAVVAQFATAVGAAVTVAGLVTSISDFGTAEVQHWRWQTMTVPADPGYPFEDRADTPGLEVALTTEALADDWFLDAYGVSPSTTMVTTEVDSGRWLHADDADGVVLASRFAHQLGYDLGDPIDLELPTGTHRYTVVGTVPVRSTAVFVAETTLAADLGAGDGRNVVWSTSGFTPPASAGVAETVTRSQLYAEDQAARDAIVAVFGVIGAIVVGVAALGLASTVGMNVAERRRELAALRAVGASRRAVSAVVSRELWPLAVAGWAGGLALGWAGSWSIMALFSRLNAIDLGYRYPTVASPMAAAAVVALVVVVSRSVTRHQLRRPPAAVLRAAT